MGPRNENDPGSLRLQSGAVRRADSLSLALTMPNVNTSAATRDPVGWLSAQLWVPCPAGTSRERC